MPYLSILIWVPLLGIVALALLPKGSKGAFRWISLGITLFQLVWTLIAILPAYLDASILPDAAYLKEQLPWIQFSLGSLGEVSIQYLLGVDGMAISLILLTVIVMPIAVLSSWNITKRVKAYFMLLLLLDLSLLGVFTALDFFLFYLFYEFMLLPMFFLIGIWGGIRKEYAALKFFIYTLVGSVFMLLVMIGLLFSFVEPESSANGQPVYTLNMLYMMEASMGQLPHVVQASVFDVGQVMLGVNSRLLAFAVLFIGFAIKLPMVPFHTWLPDAHVEAPTPVSVILAGIVLKVGAYGMIRICLGIFPDGAFYFQNWIAWLGVVSIIYGAMVAMAQTDLKRLVAYSSVSHMGFVLLGISSLTVVGLNGAVYQLFTHGLISSMLFLLVGVIYDRVHDREIANFRGLWNLMPRYAFFTIVGFFASLGLPGLAAFVSELLVFMGGFTAAFNGDLSLWVPILSTLGILLGAVYYLRTYRSMFFGTFDEHMTSNWKEKLTDLHIREYLMLTPLALLIILLGLWPSLVLDLFQIDVSRMAQEIFVAGKDFTP
ncbi:MAG: NADH-quinone oxidoreductase subunit M [Bacteroidota bacterium]